MTIDDIVRLTFLVIATEAVTEIIVAAKITDGLRLRIKRRAHPLPPENEPPPPPTAGRKAWIFIDDLLSCGYCTSVWVGMFWGLFAPWFFRYGSECWFNQLLAWVINWLLAVVVLHRLSNWFHVLFMLVKNGRVRTYDIELKLPSVMHNVSVEPIRIDAEVNNGSPGQSTGTGTTTPQP